MTVQIHPKQSGMFNIMRFVLVWAGAAMHARAIGAGGSEGLRRTPPAGGRGPSPKGNLLAMTGRYDTLIIGAGAAGLATAIFAAEAAPAMRIALLDSARRIGAKILVAGGGRCNVTHDAVSPDDYFANRNIVRNVLAAFGVERTVEWFASMGVELKREPTGKLFPVTDTAATVRDALVGRCQALGVDIRTSCRVSAVRRAGDAFALDTAQGPVHAANLVLATGGRSLPRTGSDGHGWHIARTLGHRVTDTHAALVPLVLDSAFIHADLSGISHDVEVRTFIDGKLADRRTGSMLWTHFGLSGPVIMDASRHWTIAHDAGRAVAIQLNLLAGAAPDHADAWLQPAAAGCEDRSGSSGILANAGVCKPGQANESVGTRVARALPQRVAGAVCAWAGVDPATPMHQLKRGARRAMVGALTELAVPVVGHRGWNHAEVTAGGVPLKEIDHRTMRSRLVDGLWLVGEMLDCDGCIGGFNFQWAWATGHLAGRALAANPRRG